MGMNVGIVPLYGWGEKSDRAADYVLDMRFKRESLIATLSLEGINAPMTYKGTLNGDLFGFYVVNVLAPTLNEGDVLVLDSLSVHKVKGVLRPLWDKGVWIVFLPVYSPDLNPIELVWSKMKMMIRKLRTRTEAELQVALTKAIEWITSDDIKGYFKHCGYASI
ncbi:MAG: transposase [Nitrososphaerota archaeon]|jgi:transposase|nr:transposase [Nitrososphaerota archaeon]